MMPSRLAGENQKNNYMKIALSFSLLLFVIVAIKVIPSVFRNWSFHNKVRKNPSMAMQFMLQQGWTLTCEKDLTNFRTYYLYLPPGSLNELSIGGGNTTLYCRVENYKNDIAIIESKLDSINNK